MIHWFSPNRQEASARRDTRTPWPQSGPKWTRRAPPYTVDATGLVRSHAHHWSMCGYIAEHHPMLKSSNTRRSGSLPGCCASPRTTVDMRQRLVPPLIRGAAASRSGVSLQGAWKQHVVIVATALGVNGDHVARLLLGHFLDKVTDFVEPLPAAKRHIDEHEEGLKCEWRHSRFRTSN